ncbi:MAG: MFS transporter [Chloroflexota bacterium]
MASADAATIEAASPVSNLPAPVPTRLPAIIASLRHGDFRTLWYSICVLSAGQWIQQVTLGWLVYEMTGSPVMLGLMHTLRSSPFLFAGPLAGVAADRMDRRKLLLAMQPMVAAAAFVMGVLTVSGWLEVWHVFAFTLFASTIWAINNPIRQALVPNLVPRADMMNAIALSSAAFNIFKIVGPALGGVFIAWFGPGGNFFLEAGAWTLVLLLFFRMRVPPTPPDARRESALANLKEGWVYIWRQPMLRTLLIASLVPPIFVVPAVQWLLPVVGKDVLHVGPEGLGMLMASGAVGAVISTAVLASLDSRLRHHGVILITVIGLMGVTVLVFAFMTDLWAACLVLSISGAVQMFFYTMSNTMLQIMVPDELRGRVNSIFMTQWGIGPVGTVFAGAAIEVVGAQTTLAAMGAAVIALAVLLIWRAPSLWQYSVERRVGR